MYHSSPSSPEPFSPLRALYSVMRVTEWGGCHVHIWRVKLLKKVLFPFDEGSKFCHVSRFLKIVCKPIGSFSSQLGNIGSHSFRTYIVTAPVKFVIEAGFVCTMVSRSSQLK